MYKIFPYLALLLLAIKLAYAGEIQVSVDRNPVGLNESFRIIFTANEEPDGNPDFSSLNDNFEILNNQHGSTSSWVNGESTRTEQWILQVMAKHSGDLLIPPIAFGADSSKPISVKVTDDNQQLQNNDEIFLDVQASPEQPFVQSQVLLTVRLYRRLQIVQASLDEPDIKDAVIEKLVEDNTYTTQLNNIEYVVTERKYAIFPQQSGIFSIPPLTMVAQVISSNGQPSIYGFMNRRSTETRRITSKPITLNVQPAPQHSGKSAWLSAESLELRQHWSDDSLQVKVGEPLTRTLTLTAKAATVGQLPELVSQNLIDGIKSYPDQPQLREDKTAAGLSSFRQEKIAYIPTAAGEYHLPAIQIDWFNTKTGKMESVSLPEVTIKALAASDANTTTPVVSTPANQPSETASQSTASATQAEQDDTFWKWLSALLGLGWLLNLLWFYRHSRTVTAKAASETPVEHETLEVEKTLKQACANNDQQTAKQALLRWAKIRYACNNLTALANQCPEPLSREILALNNLLYAPQQQDWDGQTLWQAFVDHKLRQAAERKVPLQDTVLEPLFKL